MDSQQRQRGEFLPYGHVCACLNDTGGRKVTVWQRCERCHALMDGSELAEDLEAAEGRVDALTRALEAIRDYRGEPSASHAWDMEMREIARRALGERGGEYDPGTDEHRAGRPSPPIPGERSRTWDDDEAVGELEGERGGE